MRVAVVIPARNEEASLAAAIRSVLHQTQPAHRIVVVVNNSSDRTEQVARGFADQGVEVVVMAANPDRKAGALNHAVMPLLVQLHERDAVLTMDADTELAPDFIATAAPHLLTRTRPDGRRGPSTAPSVVCTTAAAAAGCSGCCNATSSTATTGGSPAAAGGRSSSSAPGRCTWSVPCARSPRPAPTAACTGRRGWCSTPPTRSRTTS
jgi:glycosyltransferase involved in cell wall biosynthesis